MYMCVCIKTSYHTYTYTHHRDDLRRQLEETHLPAKASMPPPPTFNFFSKTSATVGTSGQALGAQTQAPPTSALRNGWTSSIAGMYVCAQVLGPQYRKHYRPGLQYSEHFMLFDVASVHNNEVLATYVRRCLWSSKFT